MCCTVGCNPVLRWYWAAAGCVDGAKVGVFCHVLPIMSCLNLPCLIPSCQLFTTYPVMSTLWLSCFVCSYLVHSCLVMPIPLTEGLDVWLKDWKTDRLIEGLTTKLRGLPPLPCPALPYSLSEPDIAWGGAGRGKSNSRGWVAQSRILSDCF